MAFRHFRKKPGSKIGPDRTVTYMSAENVQAVGTPSVIISIGSKYDNRPTFKVEHKEVLRLHFGISTNTFEPHFDEAMAKQIVELIDRWPDNDIIVHCGEGRIRSSSIARGIEYYSKGEIRVDVDHPLCSRHMHQEDRQILRTMGLYVHTPSTDKESEHADPGNVQ